ncbi:flagellar hook-associated protein FlgL [Paracandidimonas soli]|uniref:Flagellar hook-associated protein 3 FlgL n=1 Tax=Paracandidimonas soli TaxID=1917182 RepID=A0A4R3VB39_9BURK|nr:flagellar hook-associated protein FlgL [Paracandidimonas soli]TCV00814.1 flagellar hook-associated protein 3 FlgL [Paracandidimonas soli]
MRISTSLFFQTGLNSLNAQQADLLHIYQQVGSGRRMVTPSDDPLAAAQAINISQSQSMNERYAANRGVAQQSLGIEEETLNSVTVLLSDIKRELVNAGNGTLSDADRRSLAGVLRSAKENMLALANATDGNGQYLFSGFQGSQQPFDSNGVWQNFAGDRLVQVDQTRQIDGGDLGSDVFARATPGTQKYLTTANTGNTGTAVISTASITDPAGSNVGNRFEIAFSAIDPADPAAGMEYTVTVKDPAGAIVGTPTTSAYDASAGTTLQLPGGVSIRLEGQPADGDSFNADPAREMGTAELNIFASFDNIIEALESSTNNNTDAAVLASLRNELATAIQRFDVHYDNVLTVRSSVGARLAELDSIDYAGMSRNLGYSKQLASLQDLDYNTATTQLQLRSAALEAAALAFRKIQSANLLAMRGN